MGNSPIIYRPSIEIELINGRNKTKQMAIVDSGTDISLMDFGVAKVLNVDFKSCEKRKVGGITGSSVGYRTDVEIIVERFTARLKIPVIFVEELNTGILLGQIGFFEHFVITFDKKKSIFTLKENT